MPIQLRAANLLRGTPLAMQPPRTGTATVLMTTALGPGAAGDQRGVAVVGAGFAGLAAAAALQAAGVRVTVLEAGTQPGGRARTQSIAPGLCVELGATWLHGLGTAAEPNPIFSAARGYDLIPTRPRGTKWWNSRFLLPGRAEALAPEEEIAVTRALEAFSAAVDGVEEGSPGSVRQYLDAAWQGLAASGVLGAQAALAARAWRWRELLQRAIDGCDSTAAMSAAGLAAYDEMEGGVHAPIPTGFQSVAVRLAEGLDVRYGHEVQRLEWGPRGVALTCSNGARLEAAAAVVTVSLGVLKARHQELFHPPLPAAKAEAISRLSIGTVDKVTVDFESPIRPGYSGSSEVGPAGALSRGAVLPGDKGVVSYALLWEDDAESSSGGGSAAGLPPWARGVFSLRFGGPEFKRLRPSAAAGGPPGGGLGAEGGRSESNSSSSDEEEADESLRADAQVGRPTVRQAVAWITGAEAAAMEAATDAEVLAGLRALAARFPGLALPDAAAWEAARLHRSRWGADPRFRGSYSYVGCGASLGDVDALAAPVRAGGAPVLLFAGEACHPKYIGTTHGAHITGERAARELLGWLDNQKQQAAAVQT